MTIELQAPQQVTSLRTAGLLGTLTVRVWNATVQDTEITDEVTHAKKADPQAGAFIKKLLANYDKHKVIMKHRQKCYNWFKRESFPWAGSQGYIPNIRVPVVQAEYDALEAERVALVEDFLHDFPNMISNRAFTLGQMFKREDYPSVEDVRSKFSMDLVLTRVPDDNFTEQFAAEAARQYQQHYNTKAQEMLKDIHTEQLRQLADVMESLSHCCDLDIRDVNGETKVTRRRLHESTIHKALKYIDVFRSFNPAGSAEVEGIRAGLERVLTGVSIDQLRNSDSLRSQVKGEIDDLKSKFGF